MVLIIGLGNPGEKYEFTRHNAGFIVARMLAERHKIQLDKLSCKAVCGKGRICGKEVIIALPQTYMNESGISTKMLMSNFRIFPEDIIVIYDDMDLDVGQLRIRERGSAGTHNGMKSIIYHIEDDNFKRIRIGIGKPERKGAVDYVLGEFSKDEIPLIKESCENAVDAIDSILARGIGPVMNKYNKTKKTQKEEPETENS